MVETYIKYNISVKQIKKTALSIIQRFLPLMSAGFCPTYATNRGASVRGASVRGDYVRGAYVRSPLISERIIIIIIIIIACFIAIV